MKIELALLISCAMLIACGTAVARSAKPAAKTATQKPPAATAAATTADASAIAHSAKSSSVASIAPEPRSIPATSAHPAESALAPESGATIVYQRIGGVTDRKYVWVIYSDGRVVSNVVSNASAERRTSSAAVATLLSEIEAAGFFDLPDIYQANTCNACSLNRVTVMHSGRTKTIEAQALKPANVSPAFGLVIDRIIQFVSDLPQK